MSTKKIRSALISVYHKDNLEPIIRLLQQHGVQLYSTGGTRQFIESLGAPVTPVETLTGYPSILGGRVKTLHPLVMGGILARRDEPDDRAQVAEYGIPEIDLVVVDLYPFEQTLASGAGHDDIIEKIDIGGIALIRSAAKNYRDVLVVASMEYYGEVFGLLQAQECATTMEQRQLFAARAFDQSSHYDAAIFGYFNRDRPIGSLKMSLRRGKTLRYGENPHQRGTFYGNLDDLFEQLHGKELSYNNLVDVDGAVSLVEEFKGETAFVIVKHTNACGCATGAGTLEAYQKALEADPVSAFGGVLATNAVVDGAAAAEINNLFFEILAAPGFTPDALELLKQKKNRILLLQKRPLDTVIQVKSVLNGVIEQDRDLKTDAEEDLEPVTERAATDGEIRALLFASKVCKHTKSNTIVLAREGQLVASGVGQTSRVDALKQAIEKAKNFSLSLEGAVMASDAFFPFPDCVEIAHKAGIRAVIQPGGSVRDKDSIDFCDRHGMAMVFTGVRHFKH